MQTIEEPRKKKINWWAVGGWALAVILWAVLRVLAQTGQFDDTPLRHWYVQMAVVVTVLLGYEYAITRRRGDGTD